MNYGLNTEENKKKIGTLAAMRGFLPLLSGEGRTALLAGLATLANSAINLSAPLIIAHIIDTYIVPRAFSGVVVFAGLLLGLYLVGLLTSYAQTRLMGGIGQRVLYRLRTNIFNTLQGLPVAFFNANKAGDLISRINNDTDKLNQFFSQTVVQFIGSLVIMVGAAVFILFINFPLGIAALLPAFALLLFTRALSPWVKRSNAAALTSTGGLSAEVSESLQNFKVVVAYDRRDFFRKRFQAANNTNYASAVTAGIANNSFAPVFGFSTNIAQLIVLAYGLYLISTGSFTLGLLVGFLAYVANFYGPLRQLAAMWANFQLALASWDRVSAVLEMKNDLVVLPAEELPENPSAPLLSFEDVTFRYTDDESKTVLRDINFELLPGKTYALVGPTGGGKTTTASLMARLYDPTTGVVRLKGRDIRTIDFAERARAIGFILQEPILFSGTVRDNILYGNEALTDMTDEALTETLRAKGLERLLTRFERGLSAPVATAGDALSLGQKQLIAFMRAVLREPELLILDEATANIDTVTEQMLEEILEKLPERTTLVVIAHRLNTIEDADEILFVNGGEITRAGGMEHAVDLLLHGKRES